VRRKIAEYLLEICENCECLCYEINEDDKEGFTACAAHLLSLICPEIVKVENPNQPLSNTVAELAAFHAFEQCRQKILALLKEDKTTQEILNPDNSGKPASKPMVEIPSDYLGHGKGQHNLK
jgi:hypothetical protein